MDIIQELQDFTGEEGLHLHGHSEAQSTLDSDDNFPDAEDPSAGNFSLDSLLAESMSAVRQEQATKEARKRLARTDCSDADRLAAEALVKKWDLERVWTAEASVAWFAVQQCSVCGCAHEHFIGYFERQSHRTSKIMRWQRIDAAAVAVSKLPRELKEEVERVDLCSVCCHTSGWK